MSLFSELDAVSSVNSGDELLVSQAGTFKRATRSQIVNNTFLQTDALGNVVAGSGSLPRAANDGFLWLPSVAGAPSGVPAGSYVGRVPFVFDSTNRKLYGYSGGAWIAASGVTWA